MIELPHDSVTLRHFYVLVLCRQHGEAAVAKAKSYRLFRVGPVHFQPLECEMRQVDRYFRGLMLNAGCGTRDISELLCQSGATAVVNYDLKSSLPGAVAGNLAEMPFRSDQFDAIVCNAVLEHVPDIDRTVRELVRVLRPGGYLIAAVPYLQPYHRDPADFRRFTHDGLEEMGRLHGLTTIEILPVHSIAQTLGWIAWEWAKEKRGWRTYVVFPIVWLATRLFHKTDRALRHNANAFQIVYTK